MTGQPFYKRLDWWLSIVGGFFIGYGLSHYFTGSAVVASVALGVGLATYAASFVVINRRYP